MISFVRSLSEVNRRISCYVYDALFLLRKKFVLIYDVVGVKWPTIKINFEPKNAGIWIMCFGADTWYQYGGSSVEKKRNRRCRKRVFPLIIAKK